MLLKGAKIMTMDADDIPDGYVRILNGKIAAVGPRGEMPQPGGDEEVLDLGGRLVLPGFIDAHSHIGLFSSSLGIEGDDINEDADPSTPHLRAIDGIDPMDAAFAEALRGGVTCAVVSPGSANPVGGQVCAIKTRGRWVDEMAVMQPLAVKFALGENPKMTHAQKPQSPVTRMGTAALIREQLAKAQRYRADVERAADEDADPPEFDARCEALLPLLQGEVQAHFHAHKAYDILTAVRLAKEFSLRYTVVHGTEAHLVADILAQEGVSVVCGPMIGTKTKPELAGLTAETCAALVRAGANIAISTDFPEVPADMLLLSASVAQVSGLCEREALYALTLGAAKAVGLDGRLGSVTPGKDADLLVFSGGLSDVGARPDIVFLDGERVVG